MSYDIFQPVHEDFRKTVREFIENELAPHADEWEEAEEFPREVFKRMGDLGFLGMSYPEEYGGDDDRLAEAVLTEELPRCGSAGVASGIGAHIGIAMPQINRFGTPEQKEKYLIPGIKGETIGALGVTEPEAGSDVAGIKTYAVRDGSDWIVNGSKTFITNGGHADRVLVVAKTDPKASHAGISLIMVDADSEGFSRGPQIEKLGQHASDTTELFFDDVRVPAENLVGAEGTGFIQLMEKLVPERMIIAVGALSAAEAAFEITLDYVKERTAFGRPIGSFQNSRFKMAEIKTELTVGRAFVDQCIEKHVNGELSIEEAAMAKWWTTELLGKVTDECLQLHGGYGYTNEYDISRAWVDARITRIYGGTTEIMKELIGRGMGL